MRLPHLFWTLALLLAVGASTVSSASAAETLFWIGVRSGLTYYNETDPDDLEDLATTLSIERQSSSGRRINFDEKGWEIPFGLQLGARLSKNLNLWGFFHRMPYTLEAPSPNIWPPPNDTVRLDIPANVFGGGLDFRLGNRGYGSSLLMSVALGTFDAQGDDRDVRGIRNFEVDASGFYWEVSLMAELDFSAELAFYPYIAFQATSTDEVTATILPRPDALIPVEPPPFDIDYMAVTVGISVRFRVYPFDTEGDPDPDPEEYE